MAEKKIVETDATPANPVTKGGRSLFVPLAMITIGVLFLLDNLNVLPPLNWGAALRFWPLALIFAGLDVLAVQFRRPLGTVLSLLVTAAALTVFGYLLLSGSPSRALWGLGLPLAAPPGLRQETVALGAVEASAVEVTLNLSNYPTTIGPLHGDGLMTASVWTRGEVQLEQEREDDGRLALEFGVRESPLTWLDPRSWSDTGVRPWAIELNRDMPLDLRLDAGNGSTTAALDELTLTVLALDSGNGGLEATLPAGDYDIAVDSGNGRLTLTLPHMGRQAMRVDSGNGSVQLILPQGVAARVEYDAGNGRLNVDERFTLVSGDRDEGVYETAGYNEAADGIAIHVNSGNGSVTISTP
jgi:hypothetical protein